MSSILTNNSAQIALKTLKNITAEMATTQAELATGKRVARPGDNAATWAISKAMEADVAGFKRVSDNLTTGQSTVSVARQGAETITDLLTEVKGLVVQAQGENVDRQKIQNSIEEYSTQIQAVVDTASFNGKAMLDNRDTTAGSGSMAVLASIDRGTDGVSSTDITIRKRDLGTAAQTISATGGTYSSGAGSATLTATQSGTIDVSAISVAAGKAFSISLFGTDANGSSFDQASLRTTTAAAETQAEMAASEISYVAHDGDTMSDVLSALTARFDSYAQANDIGDDVLSLGYSGSDITVASTVTDATDQIRVSFNTLGADAGNTIGGGLDMLNDLDVSSASGASQAMVQIESLLATSIDSAAAFGSDQGRLETQHDFIGKITATLQSGIGQMVDVDLEESSARLQALQVQQQLAQQALSIANSAPQTLLGLFR